ncbi:hypothetical protein ACTID9_03980 [Brevibacillus fluminis]|uniref:hypothetical protein n=1 Tax=Brevibacillus fluminis TaxID=511487 RepID=UPI003F886F58
MHNLGQFAFPALLIIFILYRRIKRSVGFQKFAPRRMRFRMVIFAIIGLLLLVAGYVHPILYLADAAGIACGILLAFFAVRHCTFEWRGPDLYHRTHIGIEMAVLALFLGRIAFRFAFMFSPAGQAALANDPTQMQQYSRDPWTAFVFFILVAYYIWYYRFLLKEGTARLGSEKTE